MRPGGNERLALRLMQICSPYISLETTRVYWTRSTSVVVKRPPAISATAPPGDYSDELSSTDTLPIKPYVYTHKDSIGRWYMLWAYYDRWLDTLFLYGVKRYEGGVKQNG